MTLNYTKSLDVTPKSQSVKTEKLINSLNQLKLLICDFVKIMIKNKPHMGHLSGQSVEHPRQDDLGSGQDIRVL